MTNTIEDAERNLFYIKPEYKTLFGKYPRESIEWRWTTLYRRIHDGISHKKEHMKNLN